ncbi:TPR-like protein [Coprinellus micaceus]|uniref:TPR-like protein n=1 Tax=Coprinellus micaceus TaxID=71717 RepID=A0A4Y7RYZ9_COPMI|nr:TPR-like protein [Coprinellus micaceus]
MAYENALRHNPMSLPGLTQVAGIARIKENYPKAIEYFQRVLALQEDNGEVWSALGHCYLMQDDLQKAYSAYQQALYLLPNPKEDPKLWYGIGILYDRYGSLDHAEEAFSSVLRMDKGLDFDKTNEILFRLGIIYKQQGKYEDSLNCFDRILRNPPSPLAHADIWFQIGHVYEQQKDYHRAKDAYERVVADNPSHAKVLQQLGWLYHQDGSSFQNQDLAIQYLTKSLEADPSDAQSWYLLGRAYMAGSKYNKAYEAYQQAVYRDGRNPTFWCSIGVLYFQINQYRDALDAYSRAIRINPYISEVWFDLGSLYESCNNQINDAIDAYARAAELDPSNPAITQRLQLLKQAQSAGGQLPPAPGPQDVHPTAYASAVVPPPGLNGPLMVHGGHRNAMRADSRGPTNDVSLPPAQLGNGRASSPPFRGGPPPPVNIDESRHSSSSHPPLAPMEVDRPLVHPRDYPPPRDGPGRGPSGHQNILSHGLPPPPGPDDMRTGHPSIQDGIYRGRPPRSHSNSPAPHNSRPRSPGQHGFNYPPPRQQVGPGQPTNGPQRSPRLYTTEHDWDRERDRRPRNSGEFQHPPPGPGMYQHSPQMAHRPQSPPQPSPRSQHGRFWDTKPATAPPSAHMQHARGPSPPPPPGPSRYDPARFGNRERDAYDAPIVADRGYGSPENPRGGPAKPHRRVVRESKEVELHPHPQQGPIVVQQAILPPPHPSQSSTPIIQDPNVRKRRKNVSKRKDDSGGSDTPKPEQQQRGSIVYSRGGPYDRPHSISPSEKMMRPPHVVPKGPSSPDERQGFKHGSYSSFKGSPEPVSAARSVQPSPISAPRPPVRSIDEDYDEGVDALMGLAQQHYRGLPPHDATTPAPEHPAQSPAISPRGRQHGPPEPSPRPPPSHRNSVSSQLSHASPSTQAAQLKRPRSPVSDNSDQSKRSRTDTSNGSTMERRKRTSPVQSTRPSPIPFRQQPASHSPESRNVPVQDMYGERHSAGSPPPLGAVVLPPHPRPVGAGHSSVPGPGPHPGRGEREVSMALPPIATLSPPQSPRNVDRDDRMQVDDRRPRTTSPPMPIARKDPRGMSRTPPSKHTHTPSPPMEKEGA